MHRESITESLLGTIALFNTVFEIPPDMGMVEQILAVGIIFYTLLMIFEEIRKWEHKKRVRRAATRTDK